MGHIRGNSGMNTDGLSGGLRSLRGSDIITHKNNLFKLCAIILLAQAIFWGLTYGPWQATSINENFEPIPIAQSLLAELPSPDAAAADAASYQPITLPYTDCCDPAYLSLLSTFDLGSVPQEGLGLLGYQQVDNYIVRINGHVVHQLGRMHFGEQSFHGQRPHLVRIPAGVLQNGTNQINIITVRQGLPYSDLIPPMLGRYDQIEEATARRYWQLVDYRQICTILTVVLGIFSLVMLFRSQDRRFAAWLTILCWSWAGFGIYGLYLDIPIGGLTRLIIFFMLFTALSFALLGFIDAWTGKPLKALQIGLPFLWAVLIGGYIAGMNFLSAPTGYDLADTIWMNLNAVLGIAVIVRLLWHFGRNVETRYAEAAILSICALCLVLDGVGGFFGLLSGGYLMDAAPLLLLAFFVAFLHRNYILFRSAMDLNNLLEETVQAREAELADAHERERQLAEQQARDAERRRLMRDMHDGVGGELVSLLLAVRRGTVDQQRIAEGLQLAMDEIRLMINSVDAQSRSLSSMLDLFESRVRPRVMDAGFSLDWNAESEILSDLAPGQVLHLFRIMQEAVTNALKHSGGDTISIRIQDTLENGLTLQISDNGNGLTPHQDGGHGLHNMQSRAQAAGGQLAYHTGSDGLSITLHVPATLSHIPEAA
jgi:two-component system sensor histidine kinase UhpB